MVWFEAFAWGWMGIGVAAGAALGLGFHRPDMLGGYDAWTRRLMRLGHIAFFGTGMLCLLMAGTLSRHELGDAWETRACVMMASGAVMMPLCCLLAAWRAKLRALFAMPVVLIGTGIGIVGTRLGAMAMSEILSKGGAL